jgi:phospholipid transport system substrate-binding protein
MPNPPARRALPAAATRCLTPISIPTPSDPGRRRALALFGAAAAAGLAVPAAPARALTGAEARNLVERLVAEITAIINSGQSEARLLQEFERAFTRYADVPIIAQTTLGVDWRAASQAQRRAYVAAFTGYVSRKYGRRFNEFVGGRVTVTGVRTVRSFQEVNSIAELRGQAPFRVDWLVSDQGGRPAVFNLFVDGISMLATERAEIGAMLDRRGGNIDALIADLNRSG